MEYSTRMYPESFVSLSVLFDLKRGICHEGQRHSVMTYLGLLRPRTADGME